MLLTLFANCVKRLPAGRVKRIELFRRKDVAACLSKQPQAVSLHKKDFVLIQHKVETIKSKRKVL